MKMSKKACEDYITWMDALPIYCIFFNKKLQSMSLPFLENLVKF